MTKLLLAAHCYHEVDPHPAQAVLDISREHARWLLQRMTDCKYMKYNLGTLQDIRFLAGGSTTWLEWGDGTEWLDMLPRGRRVDDVVLLAPSADVRDMGEEIESGFCMVGVEPDRVRWRAFIKRTDCDMRTPAVSRDIIELIAKGVI